MMRDYDSSYTETESSYVYDLFFTMYGECNGSKCEVTSTLESNLAEDEFDQITIEVDLDNVSAGQIYSEVMLNDEDGRDYHFACYYNM